MDKYILKNVPICRSRREGEADRIPSRDDIKAMVDNFDTKMLQVPICPHEGAEKDMDSYGWILKLGTKEQGGDLFLVAEEAELVSGWFATDLLTGRRGPRSIRWHSNPYQKGPQILHLAFLGSENPAVDGLAPISPEQIEYAAQPAEDPAHPEYSYQLSAELAAETLVTDPVSGKDLSNVPSNREEESLMEINDKDYNQLKAEAEAGKDLKLRLEENEKALKAERQKSFDLSLGGVLAAIPEGARDRIEKAAKTLAEKASFDDALEFAKDLAKDAAPPKVDGLTNRLPDPKPENKPNADPLYAFNLSLAEAFKGGK